MGLFSRMDDATKEANRKAAKSFVPKVVKQARGDVKYEMENERLKRKYAPGLWERLR